MSVLDLTSALNKYQSLELDRLSKEVNFIDKISTNIDTVLSNVTDGLFQTLSPKISAQTTTQEDKDLAKSLLTSAVDKVSDPSLVSGISDTVNRGIADSVGFALGSYSASNLIGTIANRATGTSDRLLTQIPSGSLGTAGQVDQGIYDTSKKVANKVFNTLGATLQYSPNVIPQFAQVALTGFVGRNTQLSGNFTHFNSLVGSVATNCAAIDSSYYAVDQFQKALDGRSELLTADARLVRVRSKIIYGSGFDEYTYELARDNVEAAAAIFATNGNPVNLIIEIDGLLSALDYLIKSLEDAYNFMYAQYLNMIDFMSTFLSRMLFSGPMLAITNMIQAELRSIIRSVEAVVARRQPAILPFHMRLWWLQCLALAEQMYLTPAAVTDYFNTDPDGYIADYVPVSSGLSAIPMGSDIELLKNQVTQLRFLVTKKLQVDVPATSIVNLASQMVADNTTRIANISSASAAANLYSVPVSGVVTSLMSALTEAGMDRARSAVETGDTTALFAMTADDASSVGKFDADITAAVKEAESNPSRTFDGTAALTEAHRYVRNQKRSRELNAATFSRFKEDAKEYKVREDIPETQRMAALVERYNREVTA